MRGYGEYNLIIKVKSGEKWGERRAVGASEHNTNMFIGEYNHNLDEKGRLAVPVKFRAQLKGGAVALKGFDNCLVVYTKEEFQKLATKVASLPFNKSNDRDLARFLLGSAMEIDFDTQGRATLPEYLRTFANLKKKVIITGLFNRLEVWDEESWNKRRQKLEQESNSIAEALDGLDIN